MIFKKLWCRLFGHLRRKRVVIGTAQVYKCPRCGDLRPIPRKALTEPAPIPESIRKTA